MKPEVFVAFVVTIVVASASNYDDYFEEHLLIKPLANGQIYSQFKFTVEQGIDHNNKRDLKHFNLFPRSFGEIVRKHSVQELHFSLTQGIWRYENWGYPYRGAPPGVELWTWFKPTTSDIESNWDGLVNLLSGQFCASLNFIDETNTITPQWSFYPDGVFPLAVNQTYDSSYLRHATLPHEVVCTENLTPFKKLLPCDAKSGLSTLLNSVNLFGAHYLSLAIDFKAVCRNVEKDDCKELNYQITQTLSLVSDSSIQETGKQDWSFMRLFGSGLVDTCPLSSSATISVDTSANRSGVPFSLSLEPTKRIIVGGEKKVKYAVYNLKFLFQHHSRPINLAAKYEDSHVHLLIPPPALYANRYLAGYGQEHGGIHCLIYNHQFKPLKVIYLDVIPWFMRTYLHTLEIKHKDRIIKPALLHYEPAKDRGKPHHLEMILTLPPRSEVKVTLEFDYTFLKWTEYAPDANHGFYAGSAIISSELRRNVNFTDFPQEITEASVKNTFVRVHTQILLVTLPTPDFSMPYNVICLACTVVALAFGPIHNLTTKILEPVPDKKDKQKGNLWSQFKTHLNSFKQKFSSVKIENKPKEPSEKCQ